MPRSCEWCDGVIRRRGTAVRFCSRSCAMSAKWARAAVMRDCEQCGQTFRSKLSKVAKGGGRYCGVGCYEASRARKPKGCLTCGADIPITGWHGAAKYCSQRCYHDRPRILTVNPNRTYNTLWRKVRAAAIERDGARCTRCGDSASRLEVHHIVPVRMGGQHELSNVTTLCVSCHRTVELETARATTTTTQEVPA